MSYLKEKLLSSFIAFEEQKNVDSYVHGIRTKAIKKFEEEGFPTKKLENCKREDLKFCGSCNECYTPHSELVEEFDDKIADEYFCIVKEGSQAWDNRKEDINCRDIFDKDTRVRELKSKLKRNIKLRVNDPRLYHSFQIVDTILEDNELEKGFGFNLDKNAIIFEK